jgi:hypothetical protein
VAIVIITVAYALLAHSGVPQPSGFVGHSLGGVGFLLMLSTETMYSLRKRWPGFAHGRMSTWLQVHIFTGIVGPYLVLLHSAGRFQGVAGVLTVLTLIIVASGFVGRYIYTAVPRTLDGAEVSARELEDRISSADRELQELGLAAGEGLAELANAAPPRGWTVVLARPWLRWQHRQRVRRALRPLRRENRAQSARLEQLLEERHQVQMQIASLATTRRMLAVWHVVHLPLGGMLFTLAFIHIGGALYYATFSR